MVRVISVRPSGASWTVTDEAAGTDESFLGGAQAELAARDRLDVLAREGHAVELWIYLRDGSVAGRFVSPVRVLEET
ncbi:MAG TPA: hypothetical protein VIJ94_04265 [Caulobacteraceae bacterium]